MLFSAFLCGLTLGSFVVADTCFIDNPNANTKYCNFEGILRKPGKILAGPTDFSSNQFPLEPCKNLCLQDTQCHSFILTVQGVCTTYGKKTINQQPKHDYSSGLIIYSRVCFTQTSSQLSAVSTDFEDGSLSPWGPGFVDYPQDNPQVVNNGDDSSYSAIVQVISHGVPFGANTYTGMYAAANLCANTTYDFSFSVYQVPGRTTYDGSQPSYAVVIQDDDGTLLPYVQSYFDTNSFTPSDSEGNTYPTAEGTWITIEYGRFTARMSGQVSFQIALGCPPNSLTAFQVDNIQLQIVDDNS